MAEITIQVGDGSRHRFPLDKERVTIGRSRESDILLPDQWLSRHHAEIRRQGDGFFLLDMGSKNGTLLNGERVEELRRLRQGDVITIGEHVLVFSADDDDEETEPEGTQVFPVKVLSDVATKPVIDPSELAKQNRMFRTLHNATKELLEHRPLPELFETILDLLFDAVPAERAAILLLAGEPPVPTVTASRSRRGQPIAKVSRSISRKVLHDRVALLIPNILEDQLLRAQESILSTGIRSAMCAPLWYSSAARDKDAVIGLVYLDSIMRAQPFSQEDLGVVTALSNVAAAKIENARLIEESLEKRRLEEEMRMAAEIQSGLLPKGAPRVEGYGLVGSNRPSRTVGGDYYDFALEGGDLLIALGDVAGKGTGAALIMAVLRAAVRGHWNESSVADAIVRINRTVCQNVPENRYVTFFIARLTTATGRITYVNAGHNAPLLIRANGSVEALEQGGTVLGMFESLPYEEGLAELRHGDTLLVFSDGVTETFNLEGDEFGESRLVEIAARGRGLDAPALQSEILRELDRFGAGAKASDDRTLIVLKRY
jgi:serine phosphatase RsbU (regulator of sigma subunit)/pSer/pThr/pTyr-binding forkhead associated (FHA) protein